MRKELRERSPVHRVQPPGYGPFWAITKHADICRIGKDPQTFRSYPGITIQPLDRQIDRESGIGAMRTIIEIDPPQHRAYRKVASPYFTPRAMRHVEPIVEESARDIVDDMARRGGTCDFAMDVAVAHPLRVLCTILGLPREQEPRVLEHPRDDLASILANGKVGGELISPMETLGCYLITFTAGHDTTKNALAGGMHAFLHHPDEYRKLRGSPDLAKSAVEEVVCWTSPVNYMKRTAAQDAEVHGQAIAEGDELILFYGSGNRDEEVFEDPFAFRIDRSPNPHVGFGHGEHFCLGARLARRSQVALLRELASRVAEVEPDGPEAWIESSFVVGLKDLPMRYRMA